MPNTKEARTEEGRAGPRRLPRSLKRSELIAREIVKDIAMQGLQPGYALTPESVMMAEYGVGRASIREALRILEAQGLIVLKPGRKGGPVLARTGAGQLGQMMTLFLRMSGATYGDLAGFMKTVSPVLAELAAQNPDREHVREALRVSDRNPCAFLPPDRPDYGPHATINQLSGNRVLSMFADAVDTVFSGHTYAVTQGEDFLDIAARDHRAIADAVLNGEPEKAHKAMADHLDNVFSYAERKIPGVFEQPIEWK